MLRLTLTLLPALTGCQSIASASPILSIAELRQMIDAQADVGREVRVGGFVDPRCQPLSCSLMTNPADRSEPSVSLAGGTVVEPALAASKGQRIVVVGRVGNPRFYRDPDGEFVVTTDRAPEFTPLRIEN